MKVILIRHGKTQGNIEKRYIGTTDEPLSQIGIEEIKKHQYPKCDLLFASPLLRCLETAKVIYPEKKPTVVADLIEMDFGDFENKNYEELKDNPAYQKWLDSNGKMAFPNGELPADFKNRCVKSFMEIMNGINSEESVAFVVHGGTIMAIMSQLMDNPADYYSYQVENGNGYSCNWEKDLLKNPKKLF